MATLDQDDLDAIAALLTAYGAAKPGERVDLVDDINPIALVNLGTLVATLAGGISHQIMSINILGMGGWDNAQSSAVSYSQPLGDAVFEIWGCHWFHDTNHWLQPWHEIGVGLYSFEAKNPMKIGTLSAAGWVPYTDALAEPPQLPLPWYRSANYDVMQLRRVDGVSSQLAAGTLSINVVSVGYGPLTFTLPVPPTASNRDFIWNASGQVIGEPNHWAPILPVANTAAVSANVVSIAGDATAATNLRQSASTIFVGSVTGAANATTLIDSTLTQTAVNHWVGRIILFTTGVLKYEATDITGFDPVLDQLTFSALTGAPGLGDAYVIV